MNTNQYIFRGRHFKEEEIRLIQEIIDKYFLRGRRGIAKIICEEINWRQYNGRLKVTSCLEALRGMHKRGIIELPPPGPQGGYRSIKPILREDVGFEVPLREITGSLKDMGRVSFKLASDEKEERLWRVF